ncbi:hypothetical protein M0805_004165 [Coniferiporia weirii]|nr:hypothetical protein M0805_004165 [Coniferiporia weirii]
MFGSRSLVNHIDPSVVPILYSELRVGEYFQSAIVTVLVYDSITTLDKEIKYFWSSPCNSVSLIYFANRFVGVFSAIVYLWYWITINLIDYILTMRVLALFSQDKRLAAVLKILFAMEVAAMFAILAYVQVYNGTALGEIAPGITVCQSVRSVQPIFFGFSWSIPLAYELLLMILALYKAASFWTASEGFSGFNLVKILIVDQAVYFALAIFCNVGMIISDTTSNPQVIAKVLLGIMGSPSLLCVLGSHLLVHLKGAGEKGVNEGTSYRVRTLSNIEFS